MRNAPIWVQNRVWIGLSLTLFLGAGCAASDGAGSGGSAGSVGGIGGYSGSAGSAGTAGAGGTAGTAGTGGVGATGGTGGVSVSDANVPDGDIANDAATADSAVTDASNSDAMTTTGDAAVHHDASNPTSDASADAFVIDMDAALADAGMIVDANYTDVAPDSRAAYCMGQGPPVTVNDSRDGITYDVCTGQLAGRVFTNSVCACDDINMGGFLRTRSFHSGQGQTPDQAIDFGAPVGANDTYRAIGYTRVGGSFTIAGDSSTLLYQLLRVGGDLKMNGVLGLDPSFIIPAGVGYVDITRDAWFKDNVYMSVLNIIPTGLMTIGRALHQPTGKNLSALAFVNGALYFGNTPHNQPFTIPEPCACGSGSDDILDIDAMVDRARVHNDNAEINLSPDVFNLNIGLFLDLTLPCGRFYVNNIGSLGIVTLHVPGRTALFVGGSVGDLGIFDVDLGPEGELDIFIKGNLVSIGATSFGDRNRPSATRVYVSGSGDVAIVGLGEFVGNVYAPRARIFSAGYARVYGSLFGREVDMLAGLDVDYDRKILEIGDACPPPMVETDAGVGGAGGMGGSGGASGSSGNGGMSGSSGASGNGGTGGMMDAGNPPPPPVCTQCSNSCSGRQACVDNMCVGCTNDSQCCAPLVCYPSSGRCGALLE